MEQGYKEPVRNQQGQIECEYCGDFITQDLTKKSGEQGI